MADLDAPEIQPTGSGRGKLVFFLFMSGVVILVVVFLLGVSVGRGVRKAGPPADAGEVGDTTVAATPSVKPSPSDLSYHDALQGPPGAPPPVVGDGPAKPQTSTAPVKAPPVPDKPVAPPPADRPASSAREYSVQVGAFKTLTAAQSYLAQVKAKDKSYPVSTLNVPESQPLPFKVVVGPYPTLEDANRVAARLKKDGFSAMIRH